jgi:hypothetical protein
MAMNIPYPICNSQIVGVELDNSFPSLHDPTMVDDTVELLRGNPIGSEDEPLPLEESMQASNSSIQRTSGVSTLSSSQGSSQSYDAQYILRTTRQVLEDFAACHRSDETADMILHMRRIVDDLASMMTTPERQQQQQHDGHDEATTLTAPPPPRTVASTWSDRYIVVVKKKAKRLTEDSR